MLSSTLEITSPSLGTVEVHTILRRRPEEQRFPLVQPTHATSAAFTNQPSKKKKIKNHALLHHPLNPRHPPPPPPHHHHHRHPQNHSSSTRSSSSRKTTFFQTKTSKLALFLLLRQQRWRTTLRGHHMHDLDRRTRRRDEFQKSHCGV